ncbi:Fe-S cluster assembly protein SufB, partial [Candidatus Woesearchaeota archaeon CG10_big_fil_rev_8_21_14_0_10_34_8]
ISGNMGSNITMLYPCSILKGRKAKAEHISIAFAGQNQNQDTGAKVIQLAPETSSVIKAKSISKDGGITTYRGLLKINKGAKDAKSHTVCDALILDEKSISNTTPHMEINEDSVDIAHEATTGRISEDKLFYLMSRGISEEDAIKLVVSGFISPIIKLLPLEYAVELNRLIELEIEGVG